MPKPALPNGPTKPEPADTIEVSKTPTATQDSISGFTRSQATARTPPQARTLPEPALPPNGPTKPPKMTPSYESDDNGPDSNEESSHSRRTSPEVERTAAQALRAARDKLNKQQTKGQPLTIKLEVIAELNTVIQMLEEDGNDKADNNAQQSAPELARVLAMEDELREIKTMLKESLTTKKKTWAQVVAQTETPSQRGPESTRREHLEKHRTEKAKTEVLLTLHRSS